MMHIIPHINKTYLKDIWRSLTEEEKQGYEKLVHSKNDDILSKDSNLRRYWCLKRAQSLVRLMSCNVGNIGNSEAD